MKKIMLLILLLVIFLSGCGKIEMNTAVIPLAFGTDFKNNKIVISTQIAKPVSPGTAAGNGPQFTVITASGQTFSEASRNISLSFSSIPLWSQVQVSVLGEDLAKHGITTLVDFLVRNRFARKNNSLVVTHNVSPEQLLNVNPYLEPYTALAISRLIKNQEIQLGIYTPTNINDFLQRLSNPGIEPTAPMITIRKNGAEEQLLLEGTAVFKGSRMIGTLNELESRGYSIMNPKLKTVGLFLIHSPLNPEQWVTLEISNSQAKITPIIQGQQIKMKIEIKAEGNFYEQGGVGDLFTPKIFTKIEQAAEQELIRQMAMSIRKAQSLNSDIFGWGYSVYRSDPATWKAIEKDWDQRFPEIPYELNVKFDLRRSYLTDKSFVFR
jgi:spore germination protein KC